MSWLWQTVLRWTLGCMCLFQIWYPWCVCPEVGLLGHMEVDRSFFFNDFNELFLPKALSNLHFHKEYTKFPCTPSSLSFLVLVAAIFNMCELFFCVYSCSLMMFGICSYICYLLLCLLWEISVRIFCPFLNLVRCFISFCCWIVWVCYIFWMLTPCQIHCLLIYSPIS